MEESHAEAIARAILQPDLEAREKLRRKKAKEAWWLVEKRKVAWLALIGCAVGAAIAIYAGEHFIDGALWGSLSGGAVGWLWIGWHNRRGAP